MHRNNHRINAFNWRGVLIPILLILFWDWMSHRDAAHAYAFASLEQILSAFWGMIQSAQTAINVSASVIRTISGFLIGGSLGIIVGLGIYSFRVLNYGISPIYHLIRQIPLMGLVPLFALWFGNGDFSKLLFVSISSFYPLVLTTYEGLRHVDQKLQDIGSLYQLSDHSRFFKILIPGALPQIFTGISLSLSFAWLSNIGSEILFTAGTGIGNLMTNAQESSRMDQLLVLTILIGIIGLAMNLFLRRLSNYLFRWR